MSELEIFSHEYWKSHSIYHLQSRGYYKLLNDCTRFKSHGFQKMKYRTYPSFVVNDYFHRNRINSVKLRSSSICKKRVSKRSKYSIRNNDIFKMINRVRANERRRHAREYIWEWDNDC